VAAPILKSWPEPSFRSLPLVGRSLVKGLRIGRPVAQGQLLARGQEPGQGHLLAPVAGVIRELTARSLTLAVGSGRPGPPAARDLTELAGPALYEALRDFGISLPAPPNQAETVVISALDPEPSLSLAKALWAEWPAIMSQGLSLASRLFPENPLVLAWPPGQPVPADWADRAREMAAPYPWTYGPLLRKRLGLVYEKSPRAFFESRTIYLMGQAARSSRPPQLWPLAIQGQSYLVPLGLNPWAILEAMSLAPQPGDALVVGGTLLGWPTARAQEGLGPEVAALWLVRSRDLSPDPGPCRGCRACAVACPLGLPIATLAQKPLKAWPGLGAQARLWLNQCPNCGHCAQNCPAHRPLRYLTSWPQGPSPRA
jgi:electron transport complex protein RnfC